MLRWLDADSGLLILMTGFDSRAKCQFLSQSSIQAKKTGLVCDKDLSLRNLSLANATERESTWRTRTSSSQGSGA